MRQVSFTDLEEYLPTELRPLEDPQTAIPAIAKERKLLGFVEAAVQQVPTIHDLYLGDAREMPGLAPERAWLQVDVDGNTSSNWENE